MKGYCPVRSKLYLDTARGNPRNSARGATESTVLDAGRTGRDRTENVGKVKRIRATPRNRHRQLCALGRTWGPNVDRGSTRDRRRQDLEEDNLSEHADRMLGRGHRPKQRKIVSRKYTHPGALVYSGAARPRCPGERGGETWTKCRTGNTVATRSLWTHRRRVHAPIPG